MNSLAGGPATVWQLQGPPAASASLYFVCLLRSIRTILADTLSITKRCRTKGASRCAAAVEYFTHSGILQMVLRELSSRRSFHATRIGVSDITREYSSLARCSSATYALSRPLRHLCAVNERSESCCATYRSTCWRFHCCSWRASLLLHRQAPQHPPLLQIRPQSSRRRWHCATSGSSTSSGFAAMCSPRTLAMRRSAR